MIYKYSVDHKVGFASYYFKRLRSWINQQLYRFVRPIDSPVQCNFIAGCGHSGTTLVTAKLGNHPGVLAIGHETTIFQPTRPAFSSLKKLRAWLKEAQCKGKTHLVEKTPKHVHMLMRIFQMVPAAKAVLTIRNPMDNCFSLHERFGDLEYAIERWLMDNEAVLNVLDHPNVQVIKYERLTSEPEQCFAEVCDFIGLSRDDAILAENETVFDREFSTQNMNLRREQVKQPIRLVTRKWEGKWSEAEIKQVRSRTSALAYKLGYTESDLA